MPTPWLTLLVCLMSPPPATVPASRPTEAALPHVAIDRAAGEVRIDCEALRVDAPLEFLCVVRGTSEHEAVLRTAARPSHVHLALLLLGLEPGAPVRWSDEEQRWLAPSGPPIAIDAQWTSEGRTVRKPADRLVRPLRREGPTAPLRWVFAGSRVMEDGVYAADVTGYVVSLVNFELSPIDVPQLASSSNDLLEWEINPDEMPPRGSAVTLILRAGP